MANINLNFYDGKDYYCDGKVEDDILNYFKNKENIYEILNKDFRWPVLYHLSPIRGNILSWYNFDNNANVLEIGAGCGAITSCIVNKNINLTSVELSNKRASIIYERCKDKKNLDIFVGNFNNMKFDKKFNYITLIGVLEYAKAFTSTNDPYNDFLSKIKSLLKENGKLLIAIENKFGLKYFAGAREDHTAILFDSIEGYKNDVKVETFGKKEITELLCEIGFKDLEFYYPYPDYKLPETIYSDDYLPSKNEILNIAPNYDHDRVLLFNETLAYKEISKNNAFPFFSNSFFIEARI